MDVLELRPDSAFEVARAIRSACQPLPDAANISRGRQVCMLALPDLSFIGLTSIKWASRRRAY